MIEMLGVLAIIGVLSAGGIMGYSAAMENYRVNQTIEDIQTMIANARNVFSSFKIKGGNMTTMDIPKLYQVGVVPKKYYDIQQSKYPSSTWATDNPLKQRMDIGVWEGSSSAVLVVQLYYTDTSHCVKLLSHAWGMNGTQDNASINIGWDYCTTNTVITPMKPDEAKIKCEAGGQKGEKFIKICVTLGR